jgi:hypothetical protein
MFVIQVEALPDRLSGMRHLGRRAELQRQPLSMHQPRDEEPRPVAARVTHTRDYLDGLSTDLVVAHLEQLDLEAEQRRLVAATIRR